MKHAFGDAKHLDESFATQSKSVFSNAFDKSLHSWIISLKQVLTCDQIEDSSYASLVKIYFLITVPEARHQEVVICDQTAEHFFDISQPLLHFNQGRRAVHEARRDLFLDLCSVVAEVGSSSHLVCFELGFSLFLLDSG